MNNCTKYLVKDLAAAFSPDPHPGSLLRVVLLVEGDHDPQLPLRVLARFSERNSVPTRILILADIPSACVRIELEFEASADAARQLARRLLSVPSVREISVALRPLRSLQPLQRAA